MLVEEAFLFLTGQMKKVQRGIMTKGGGWLEGGRVE